MNNNSGSYSASSNSTPAADNLKKLTTTTRLVDYSISRAEDTDDSARTRTSRLKDYSCERACTDEDDLLRPFCLSANRRTAARSHSYTAGGSGCDRRTPSAKASGKGKRRATTGSGSSPCRLDVFLAKSKMSTSRPGKSTTSLDASATFTKARPPRSLSASVSLGGGGVVSPAGNGSSTNRKSLILSATRERTRKHCASHRLTDHQSMIPFPHLHATTTASPSPSPSPSPTSSQAQASSTRFHDSMSTIGFGSNHLSALAAAVPAAPVDDNHKNHDSFKTQTTYTNTTNSGNSNSKSNSNSGCGSGNSSNGRCRSSSSSMATETRNKKMNWLANNAPKRNLKKHSNNGPQLDKHVVKVIYPKHTTTIKGKGMLSSSPPPRSKSSNLEEHQQQQYCYCDHMKLLEESCDNKAFHVRPCLPPRSRSDSLSLITLTGQQPKVAATSRRRSTASFVAGSQIRTLTLT